jgi:hypothetical protein
VQNRIDRAALAKNRYDTAGNENQENDILCRSKTLRYSHQEIPGLQSDLFVSGDVFEGAVHDHLPAFVSLVSLALERTLWNRIRQQLRDDDDREDEDQGIDGPGAFCHAGTPYSWLLFPMPAAMYSNGNLPKSKALKGS